MNTEREEHETKIINAFIDRRRRERCLELLRNSKRRRDFTHELAHFKWLDPRFVRSIPPPDQNPKDIASLLRSMGAPQSCWAISEDSDFDGQEFALEDLLKEIVGRGIGTLVSCIPGELGFFEDEEARYILQRPTNK